MNETSEVPFWGLYICVDFNSRNQKTERECKETTHEILVSTKLPADPIHEIGFPILGFITILCLKFRPLAFPVESQKSLNTRLKTNYLPQNAETQGYATD